MPTKAEVEKELADLRREHEALKERVVNRGRELAEENGLCDEVEDALIELGLVNPVKFDLVLTWRMSATPKTQVDGSMESFIEDSFRIGDTAYNNVSLDEIRGKLDDDWTGSEDMHAPEIKVIVHGT